MFDDWIRDATVDPALIARHWRSGPGAPSVGVIAGETFDVIDVEAAHVEAFRAAVASHGLPAGPIARSGRGGIHLHVRSIGTGTHRLLLDRVHIGEWKGSGGVLVPPSLTVDAYAWLRSPFDHPLPDAPAWLRSLAVVSTSPLSTSCGRTIGVTEGQARLAGLARVVSNAPEGSRNNILYWAARRAADAGIPVAVATSVLSRMAVAAGLGRSEVDATLGSAFGERGS